MVGTGYAAMIAEDLGIEVGEAAVVEQVIRSWVPTLDHLSRSALAREARISQEALAEMRRLDPEVAAVYERQAS